MKRGRYYLSRVIKLGELNQTRLIDAIAKAPVVPIGEFAWTITDVADRRSSASPYVFGNLVKFSRQGTVKLVDEPAKQQVEAVAPNLLDPDGQVKFPHPWPPQIPPGRTPGL